jgi:uncharacterized protein YqeY
LALEETIQNDLKAALLSGDRFKGDVLRGLKAAILNEKVSLGKRETGLNDAEIEKIVAREVKKRQESVRLYEENDRPELAQTEREEIAVLETYLPQQLTEAEIIDIVAETIDEMGATGAQSMGLVIKAVKDKVGNTADGGTIASIVKSKLIQ